MKKHIFSILITLLFGLAYFYLALPAINIHNIGFWVFIVLILFIYSIVHELFNLSPKNIKIKRNYKEYTTLYAIPVIITLIIIINIISSPLFNSSKFANRITVDNSKTFQEDIPTVDFTKIPLLDKNSSQKLGDRVMGQMSDLVSQYTVSDLYTQINYNDQIVRTTPLEYASLVKWITNRKEGVKGYITVNSVNGEAKLKRLEKGMKYLPSAFFNENLMRKLRFSYPTENFYNITFELDEEGNPYWIATTIKYHSVGLRAEVTGVITLDPVTGESSKYDVNNIPKWIDQAYSAELIIEQVNDWGTYQDGFFNSIFSQKNVVNTTEGYNYIAIEDDIYLYTGLTSIVSDESNLGFILTNLRTGETNFYNVPGAEEYSAMASAEGAVQQMKYNSTFPLLINLNGKPTYLVSLKDAAGLVKMYGFVDVADYQKVVVTDSSKGIEVAAKNYIGGDFKEDDNTTYTERTITIKSIKDATISGNTYYYITDEDNHKYKVSITLSDVLPFLVKGDKLKIGYSVESDIINIKKVF